VPWACVWCAVGRDDSWKAVRKAVAVSFSLQVCTVRLKRSFLGGGVMARSGVLLKVHTVRKPVAVKFSVHVECASFEGSVGAR
jgi:hypothetical protein